ncbi:unnamed protein product [Lepeophtheirus salmonis]|uniref:(salmon louse) hypothetical protein n=1 Tax=Lepeophtheirus salmonis TaxID=72036 RepID=A0A7R8CN65_LEPSM|nr:unnamed protein product [Lepeophtheirus salmonis]CAF2839353.1 unnamed protein product [Lepeophtheirus salmonis]
MERNNQKIDKLKTSPTIWVSQSSFPGQQRRYSYPSLQRISHFSQLEDFPIPPKLFFMDPPPTPPSKQWSLLCGLALITLSTSCFDLLGPSILFIDSTTSSFLLSSSFFGASMLSYSLHLSPLPPGLFSPTTGGLCLLPFVAIHFCPNLINLLPTYSLLGSWIFTSTHELKYSKSYQHLSVLITGAYGIGSGLSGALVWLSLQLHHMSESQLSSLVENSTHHDTMWWQKPIPMHLSFNYVSDSYESNLLYYCDYRLSSISKVSSHRFSPLGRTNICGWRYMKLVSLASATGIQRVVFAESFLKELVLTKFGVSNTCIAAIIFGASLAFNAWLLKNILKYFSKSLVIFISSIFQICLVVFMWNQLIDVSKENDVNTYFACASVWGSVSAVFEYLFQESSMELKANNITSPEMNVYRFLSASLMFSIRILCSQRQRILFFGGVYALFLLSFFGCRAKKGGQKKKRHYT